MDSKVSIHSLELEFLVIPKFQYQIKPKVPAHNSSLHVQIQNLKISKVKFVEFFGIFNMDCDLGLGFGILGLQGIPAL